MGSFDGVADVYHESRHGYPDELRDHLVEIGTLWPNASVLDLGAGTGQLARLAAEVAASVVAMDPEPDMVRVGQRVTAEHPGIRWITADDGDIPNFFGPSSLDLVLIGNAFHHMDQASLLTTLDPVVGPNGAVVVCSSSIPVWLQETEWSEALRTTLSDLLGRRPDASGAPRHESDTKMLLASPFPNVSEWILERPRRRSVDSIVGELISSASGAIDEPGARLLRHAIDPHMTDGTVQEIVTTRAVIARRKQH